MKPAGTVPQPLDAIAGFATLLREHGLAVGIAEQQAMVQAALRLPVTSERAVAAAWRAIACHDRRDWRRWPELFERYWHPARQRGQSRVSGQTRPARDLRQLVQDMHDSMADRAPAGRRTPDAALDGTPPQQDGEPRARGGASRSDPLHEREFAMWLPQDLAQLERLAERIAERLRRRLTRRWHGDRHGRRLDVRRTLRGSLAQGGVPIVPAWRSRRRERPRVFVLVDVSRSMQTHAQLFLRIARAFVAALGARVFVFHTRLAEVTPLLRRDSAAVQEKINAVTAGFGGGTRIATSLTDFVDRHVRSQVGRRARVWLFSDGYDADPPGELRQVLARIRARGARIGWFHPGRRVPSSRALEGCESSIERYVPLDSLRDLARAADVLN